MGTSGLPSSPASDAPNTFARTSPTATVPAGCVMVVEDEAEVRTLLEDFLILKGYRVRSVADGEWSGEDIEI